MRYAILNYRILPLIASCLLTASLLFAADKPPSNKTVQNNADTRLQKIAEALESKDTSQITQALNELIDYESITPTLGAVKLIFSLAENIADNPEITSAIEKSVPKLALNDEIIQWLEDDASRSPNQRIRRLTLRIIGVKSTEQKILHPLLLKFVYDPSEEIRFQAVSYIDTIADNPPEDFNVKIIPIMSASLTDGSVRARRISIGILGKILPSQPEAVIQALIKQYPLETSMTLRFEMEQTIANGIDAAKKPITPTFLSYLEVPSVEIQALAARIIGKANAYRNIPTEEKEKIIKEFVGIHAWDSEDAYCSRIRTITTLCYDRITPQAERILKRFAYNQQYPLSIRLFALDSLYRLSAPDERQQIVNQMMSSGESEMGNAPTPEHPARTTDVVQSGGQTPNLPDWRIRSRLSTLAEEDKPIDVPIVSQPQIHNGKAFSIRRNDKTQAYLDNVYSRFEPFKTETLKKYGGNKETEFAVKLGLDFLARTQEENGSWNCVRYNPWHNKSPLPAFTNEDKLIDVSVTGLNLLCFLASGSTHQYGPYKEVIQKGMNYILSAQDSTGMINFPKGHHFTTHDAENVLPHRYNHNISTLVLVELYAMTGDENIKDAAQKALQHSKSTPEPGFPWSFYLESTDMGTSIFYLQALKLAQATDLIVSPSEIQQARAYLDRLTDKASGRIVHICAIPICFGGMDSTSSGLFANILLGPGKDSPVCIKAADWLSKYQPVWIPFYQMTEPFPNLLFLEDNIISEWQWYYQTLAFKEIGGNYWQTWNKNCQEILLKHQLKGGINDGSWDPEGPWATIGGRQYSTAFSILTLQAYYAYSFAMQDPGARKSK